MIERNTHSDNKEVDDKQDQASDSSANRKEEEAPPKSLKSEPKNKDKWKDKKQKQVEDDHRSEIREQEELTQITPGGIYVEGRVSTQHTQTKHTQTKHTH